MTNQPNYDPKEEWNKRYIDQKKFKFPSEYYIMRIFRGTYPKLQFGKLNLEGKKIIDISCGDGRNIQLLNECGFDIYGTEITQKIVERTKTNLHDWGIKADIRVGTNDNIPFEEAFFDFAMSWNAIYYMNQERDFEKYVKEIARVIKPDGYLVLSVPMNNCYIFKDSQPINNRYRIIKDDYFKLRNGEVFRVFNNQSDIKEDFGDYFTDFIISELHYDCFGLAYNHYMVVCKKK